MHRTEGPDYATESGKRRYKVTPAPGTVVNKFAANSLQEEICLAIENYGIILAASGAADRAAGWGQLYQAMLRANMADIRGYGAVNGADSSTAINAAIAASKIIFIPEGTFILDTSVNIPDGVMIIGTGKNSVLQFKSATPNITANNSFLISNIMLDGNNFDTNILQSNFNGEYIGILQDVYVRRAGITGLKGIDIQSTTSDQGQFYIDGLHIYENPTSQGFNLNFGDSSTSVFTPKCIFKNINFNSKICNIFINKQATSLSEILFSNCNLDSSGAISIYDDTRNVIFDNCYLDLLNYFFKDTEMCIFRNCTYGTARANTINNDVSASESRVQWINCRDYLGRITEPDGTITWVGNINGIYTKRDINGSQVIADPGVGGGWSKVDFDGAAPLVYMSNNLTHSKDDDVWNSGNSWFVSKGYGDGRARVHCNILTDTTDINNTRVALFISTGYLAEFSVQVLAGGNRLYIFNGIIDIATGLNVQVFNDTAASFNVLQGSGDLSTFIEIEGL